MRTLLLWTVAMPAMIGGLAGCDDVGGGDGRDDRPTYAELLQRGGAIENEIIAADLEFTDPSTLPVSGTAEYNGVIAIQSEGSSGAPGRMVGELEMEMDFGNDDDVLSGSAGNFVTADGRELDGSLELGMGGLDRDVDPNGGGWTYAGGIGGTLTAPGGAGYDYSGSFVGDFLGDEPDYAAGQTEGIVQGPGGNGTFDGFFVAER